ncbi:MAG: rhodanese-like domain-containing protein [Gammaproteobacteria bacterium]|jgi:rhodanese-related sulfurtransferase|tara:strand:- start:2243 stop:2614 length:372 start_codon:yes stop_codon:yes gene_type:complete
MATINELLDIANDSVTRVDFDTANEMILNGAYIVDVREESEVAQSGKIKDAIHIPRGLIEFQLSAESTTNPLNIKKDSDILIYCAAGIRAALAAKTLQDLGFENVFNLGGLSEWVSSGGAIEP